jgi:hypothetical protein
MSFLTNYMMTLYEDSPNVLKLNHYDPKTNTELSLGNFHFSNTHL